MTDQSDRIRLIAALAATFNREADEAMFQGYEIGLADLPLEDVQRAVQRAIRECKFMPAVAELRGLSGVMLPADRAIKAWDVFAKAVGKHGYYTSVNFDDPIINATVRSLGGWEAACEKGGDEFDKWLRKDFERVYLAFERTGVGPEAAAPLVGFIGRTNAFTGYHEDIPEPLLIACDLPPHRDGVVGLPAPKREPQRLLTEAAASVGRKVR